jgi:hypothetical protein
MHNYYHQHGDNYTVKVLSDQEKENISNLEANSDTKICRDYFIPVNYLRSVDPLKMEEAEYKRLIFKGYQAINAGKLCVILNTKYFEESKVWNNYNWKLEACHFSVVMR